MKPLRNLESQRAHKCGAYLGYAGYASILACTREPVTARELAERLAVGRLEMRRILKAFHAMRLVHVHGWMKPHKNGIDVPVYQIGDKPDMPARVTANGKPMPHADFVPKLRPKMLSFGALLHALREPRTLDDLERESHITRSTLAPLLRHMKRPGLRLVHIHGWAPRADGYGPPSRLFMAGGNNDAPRPKPRGRNPRRNITRDIQRPAWGSMILQLRQADALWQTGLTRD